MRHGIYYNWTLPPAISVTPHVVGGELFAGFAPGQAVWQSPAQDGRGRAGVAAVCWRAKDEPACAARFDDRFERLVHFVTPSRHTLLTGFNVTLTRMRRSNLALLY